MHLHAQHHQPDHAEQHVQTVGANQGEERRQERAALRAGAQIDQMREFVDLDGQESKPEDAGRDQPTDQPLRIALLHRDHREAVGD